MKKTGLFLLMFVFAVFAGNAQPGQGGGQGSGQPRQYNPEETAKRQTQEIGEAVQFSEGQEIKVLDLNLKYAKKMQEMRSGVSFRDMDDSARQEMRKKMDAQQAEKDKELKLILTEAQYKKYEAYQQEREKQRMERRGQRPPQ